MNKNDIQHELQHILLGKSAVSQGTVIQTVARHLAGSAKAGSLAETGKHDRRQEEEQLI